MLRYAMSLVVVGTIVGLAGAYAITRVMSTLLFEVTPTDLTTFIAVPLVLLLVALIASFIPALRATRVNPLITLKAE
jgi:ABC-type antimicrobial peptide transport system permease subunit